MRVYGRGSVSGRSLEVSMGGVCDEREGGTDYGGPCLHRGK